MTNISSEKSLADRIDEGTVKFGGISGSDSIPSSWAKSRYKIGAIKQATLLTANEGVTVVFSGFEGKPLYKGESHILCDALNIFQATVFRNTEEATYFLKNLGFADQDIIAS
ncbi:hypothetical protein [Psychrobacter immobilis]|uniref:hypothetical protein n=1 Tax=Psychrobacter immobilis TaxID=498 RepID=UPI001919E095|nr:hypothetical protein [Psychrobacter immobilis]